MKLPRLIKLGHRNLIHNKKQTILTIIVIGSLFSVLIALQFIVQGVEKIVIKENERLFADYTYLIAPGCSSSELEKKQRDAENQCRSHKSLAERQQCIYEKKVVPLSCEIDTDKINKTLEERIAPYGGKIIDYVSYWRFENTLIQLIPMEPFKNVIEIDLTNKPKGSLAAIVSFNKAAKLVEDNVTKKNKFNNKLAYVNEVRQAALGKTFIDNGLNIFIAGITPYGDNYLRISQDELHFRPLDLVLQVAQSNSGSSALLIDDMSEELKSLLSEAKLRERYAIEYFSDLQQAYAYYRQEILRYRSSGIASSEDRYEPEFHVGEFITNKLISIRETERLKSMIIILGWIFLVVAIIIIVFTFLKMVQRDDKLVALYRSLGATGVDVFIVYFWYLFELCLLTVIYALVVGVILAAIVSYYYATDFNAAMSLFFAREIQDFHLFLEFNTEVWYILLIIMMSSVISSLLIINQLSAKNVAKRLKKAS